MTESLVEQTLRVLEGRKPKRQVGFTLEQIYFAAAQWNLGRSIDGTHEAEQRLLRGERPADWEKYHSNVLGIDGGYDEQ